MLSPHLPTPSPNLAILVSLTRLDPVAMLLCVPYTFSLFPTSSFLFHDPGFSTVQDLHSFWSQVAELLENIHNFHFSPSVVTNSLQPQGLQHARPPCPSPTPGVYSNSRPLSWWCHPTISSSVLPFSSYLQSFPASGFFQMSQLFASGGQSIGVSASASVLLMNIQKWSPLGWTSWISLQSKGLSRVFSNTTVQKHQFFGAQLSL